MRLCLCLRSTNKSSCSGRCFSCPCTLFTFAFWLYKLCTVTARHSGSPPFRGRHSGIRSPIRCLPVVIQGHRATWMTKSMLLNYATDYQKSLSSPFKVIQGHRYLYQSKAHIRLLIKTIARPVLCIKSWIYQSARNLYCGRRAVSLQTFTTRHSNRKWSIVMALSTTFTQYAPKITKFLKNHAK